MPPSKLADVLIHVVNTESQLLDSLEEVEELEKTCTLTTRCSLVEDQMEKPC